MVLASLTAETLAAAMVDVAASHGYAGASVARVLERSGVSRQAFYRHYSSREECFLAAYRCAAAEVGGRLREAVRRSTPAERPEAAIAALLEALEERPAAARMLFVEALGACAAVRAEHERQLAGIERAAERFLRDPGAPALRAPPAALLGGISGVLSARILSGGAGGEEDLFARADGGEDLRAGLLAWVRSYESADAPGSCSFAPLSRAKEQPAPEPEPGRAGGPLRATEVQLLPRGPSALPPALAGGARRARILAATMRQTAARGYANLTVADVVADARVPRAAFYAHFAGKQEAFLAAQTLGLRESIAAASSEFATGRSWPERVWRGLAALLDYLAAHPDLARLCLLEAAAAGPAGVARTNENRAAYAIFLAEGYRPGYHPGGRACPPPPLGSEATIAAIEALLASYLRRGAGIPVREALPRCAYVALAPFLGPEAALEWLAEADAAPSPSRPS